MRADIVAALAAVTSTAEAHAQALRDLRAVTGIDVGSLGRVTVYASDLVRTVRRNIEESDRPKGPTVRISYLRAGSIEGDAGTEELARVAPKSAFMASGRRYDLGTGHEVRAGGYYSRRRIIHPDDLAICRAMKPGHNAVSKALDAIAKEPARG